jgi:DNA mismatch endonuclease, patch repair protein
LPRPDIGIESSLLVDIVEPAKRSQMMAGIKGKNTKPEIQVRKILYRIGFRFRLHRKDMPGRPDIVIPKHNTVIFVHGCFWHGHEDCAIFRLPKSRTEFWQEKIGNNVLRDEKTIRLLVGQGWRVVNVWECALKGSSRLPIQQLDVEITNAVTSSADLIIHIRGIVNYPDS